MLLCNVIVVAQEYVRLRYITNQHNDFYNSHLLCVLIVSLLSKE